MNVVEPILFQCKLNPIALAICVPGSEYGPINYGTLERFIHNAARTALKSGIAPGSLAATYITDTILHMSLTLALMHVGVTTLSLRGPKMVPGISPDVVLTDAPGKISGGVTVLGVDRSWLENDGAAATGLNASRNVDDLPCRVDIDVGLDRRLERCRIFTPSFDGADGALHVLSWAAIRTLFEIFLRPRISNITRVYICDVAA